MESNHSKLLELNANGIELFEYSDAISSDVVHIQAVRTSSGTTGFGSGHKRDLALIRAVAELAERETFFREVTTSKVSTSSGFAAHTDPNSAKESAVREVIERDALLLSWISGHSPAWLSWPDLCSISPDLSIRALEFERSHFKLSLGILAKTGAHYTCVGAIHPLHKNEFGFVLSTSCKPTIPDGLASVTLDLQRSATAIVTARGQHQAPYRIIDETEIFKPADHLEFYLNPNNASHAAWFWSENREILDLPMFDTKVNLLPPSISIGVPLFVAHAASSLAQAYFVGSTDAVNINSSRFRTCSLIPCNFYLHPLG